MAAETSFLHLVKPTAEEHPSLADLNGNSDKLDGAWGALKNNLLNTYTRMRAQYQSRGDTDMTAILDAAILDLNTVG